MTNKTTKDITINGHKVEPLTLWVCRDGRIVIVLSTEEDVFNYAIHGAVFWDHTGPGKYSWNKDGSAFDGKEHKWDLMRPVTRDDQKHLVIGRISETDEA